VAQLIVLAVFIGLGVSAVKKFQKKPVVSARAASA
jgi:Na+/H+-dicarboxylate symporter